MRFSQTPGTSRRLIGSECRSGLILHPWSAVGGVGMGNTSLDRPAAKAARARGDGMI
jgi:hypothetical protein